MSSCCGDDIKCLLDNTGKVVTVFTCSGGCSGRGFTGLLVEANCHYIKLIGSLPSAPRCPFGYSNFGYGGCYDGYSGYGCSRFGTAIVIPVCKIVSFVFNES